MTTVEVQAMRGTVEYGIEMCDPEDADFWGVYTRTPDADGDCLAVWVADYFTKSDAEAHAMKLRLMQGVVP